MHLSRQDFHSRDAIERLLAAAQRATPPASNKLYQDIWGLATYGALPADTPERTLALDILREMASRVERNIRVGLATELSRNSAAPRDLVLMLADSSIEMASPVLMYCPVLNDEDLIALIGRCLVDHQIAIASRPNISERVCGALVEKSDDDVVVAMLNNHTAQVSERLMAALVDRSKTKSAFQIPLVLRPDLPVALAEEMYAWASEKIRAVIVCQFDVDPAVIDRTMGKVVKREVVNIKAARENADPLSLLVDKLFDAGQLSTGYLVRNLREGQIKVFEYALAKLTGLPAEAVRNAISDRNSERLANICAALELDSAVFMTIVQLTRRQRGDLGVQEQSAELAEKYQSIKSADAKAVLNEWRNKSGKIFSPQRKSH